MFITQHRKQCKVNGVLELVSLVKRKTPVEMLKVTCSLPVNGMLPMFIVFDFSRAMLITRLLLNKK